MKRLLLLHSFTGKSHTPVTGNGPSLAMIWRTGNESPRGSSTGMGTGMHLCPTSGPLACASTAMAASPPSAAAFLAAAFFAACMVVSGLNTREQKVMALLKLRTFFDLFLFFLSPNFGCILACYEAAAHRAARRAA